MKGTKLADLISELPESAALAGIRAYILHEGLRGNLEDAAKAFEQVWQCEGHEGMKAELTEFLVARYAFRGASRNCLIDFRGSCYLFVMFST